MEWKEVEAKMTELGFHEAVELKRHPVVPGCCAVEGWWMRGSNEVVYVFVYWGKDEESGHGCFGEEAFMEAKAGYRDEPAPIGTIKVSHDVMEIEKLVKGVFG